MVVCRRSTHHRGERERVIELHHSRRAEVEKRLHRSGEVRIANVFERHAMANFEVVRVLDVVVEHLCEQQNRLIGCDRESVTDGKFRRQHSLRQRHQTRCRRAGKIEDRLMKVGIEVDVEVAHQLRQLRRRSIFRDHLGADAGNPQQLRRDAAAQHDLLDARRTFHRFVFAIDCVDLGKDLPFGCKCGGRSEEDEADRASNHALKNSTCTSVAPSVSTRTSCGAAVRDGTNA